MSVISRSEILDGSRLETGYAYKPEKDIETFELAEIVVHLIQASKNLDQYTSGTKITDLAYGQLSEKSQRHFKKL